MCLALPLFILGLLLSLSLCFGVSLRFGFGLSFLLLLLLHRAAHFFLYLFFLRQDFLLGKRRLLFLDFEALSVLFKPLILERLLALRRYLIFLHFGKLAFRFFDPRFGILLPCLLRGQLLLLEGLEFMDFGRNLRRIHRRRLHHIGRRRRARDRCELPIDSDHHHHDQDRMQQQRIIERPVAADFRRPRLPGLRVIVHREKLSSSAGGYFEDGGCVNRPTFLTPALCIKAITSTIRP